MRPRRCTGASRGLEGIREFILRPGFFIFAGLVYLAAGTLAALDPATQALNPRVSVSLLSVIVFLIGLAGFWVGLRTGGRVLRLRFLRHVLLLAGFVLGTVAAHFILQLDVVFAALLNVAALTIALVVLFSRLRHEYVFATGFAVFWLNMLLLGIPLFSPELRVQFFDLFNPMFIIGIFFMVYSMIRMHPMYRYLWVLVMASAVMSAFRSYIAIAFISWLWLELRDMKRPDWRKGMLVIAGLAIVIMVSVYIGYAAKMANSGEWTLGPWQTLEYRLALTMGIFDDICSLSFPLGHSFGMSMTEEQTLYTCRVLYGCESRITSTAFGIPMLDFGLLGVFLAPWLLGVILHGLRPRDFGLYAMLFATLFITLEVGINIFVVILFIYVGWIRLMYGEDEDGKRRGPGL